jgi:adenosylmethionine-8-amino-7-oxononanoate aminotransferase
MSFDSYSLWHGSMPMQQLRQRITPDRLLVRGNGARVCDAAGRWLIDGRAGMANVVLGYNYRPMVEALADQLQRLPFAPTIRYTRPPEVTVEYAMRLAHALPPPLKYVRFYNVGSLANEAAVTLARFYQRRKGRPNRVRVLSMANSYHGATALTMAVSGQADLHGYFPAEVAAEPTLTFPKSAAEGREELIRTLEILGNVAAVILEPVMGNGVVSYPPGYLEEVREVCDDQDILLIFDEVVTGFGRLGGMFAAQVFGVVPDMMTMGKAITGGYVPMAALAVSEAVYDTLNADEWFYPNAYSTDGHALACRAGLVVLDTLEQPEFLTGIRALGESLWKLVQSSAENRPLIREVRGVGTLVGLRFENAMVAARVRDAADARGALVHCLGPDIVLTPPYVMTPEDVEELVSAIMSAVDDVSTEVGEAALH